MAIPDDPRSRYLLAMADDELVMGHRTSHWTGVAPSLEEDLAFATISQDEINHADLWYQILLTDPAAGEVDRAEVDALGLGREADEYLHAVLCERPPGDFAYTLVRQLLYDHFDSVRLAALSTSSDEQIAAVARRLAHEERYHLMHADEWLERLAGAGTEAQERLRAGFDQAWPEALWLFEPVPGEDELAAADVAPVSGDLVDPWMEALTPLLADAKLADATTGVERDGTGRWRLAEGVIDGPGGRQGRHTEDWTDDAWPEMTALYRAHPGAIW
jgi:ring-1,2-phenylacetyl-CoA epoxidase subunit PaaC